MKILPENLTEFKRTSEFTGDTVPKGLLKNHKTPTGTWAVINILSGSLIYRILEPEVEKIELSKSNPGIIEPDILHEVKLIGDVKFFVAFYK